MQGNSYATIEDMVIGEFVAYLGQDSQSKVLSTFWGNSDIIRRLIEQYGPQLDSLIDLIVTSCK